MSPFARAQVEGGFNAHKSLLASRFFVESDASPKYPYAFGVSIFV